MMDKSTPADKPLTGHLRADGRPLGLGEYVKNGGYGALRKAVTSMASAEVTDVVTQSRLAGRGGAGFPTGRKWGFAATGPDYTGAKYLVANGDEMEPGAFKDRVLMEGNPHLLLEGMAIAAYAVGAATAYLFIRAEYRKSDQIMRRAIAEAREAGYLGKRIFGSGFDVEIIPHSSAGRYICGEGSALLNALEGERPIPRHKPPHQTSAGLWSKPTVVNNVETLCCVPAIITNGAHWFIDLARSGEGGTKLYTVSGRVNRPGAWELPLGTSIRELLEEYAGGMRTGLHVTAVLPGGGSTGFVLEKDLDTPMDEASLRQVGSRLGTGTIIVLDDQTCPVGMLHNLEQFYAQESCGWCTPCWQGLHWVRELLGDIEGGRGTMADIGLLQWHVDLIKPEHTFCDLAPGAMQPLESGLRHFYSDFVAHVREHDCPRRAAGRRWG
jgi:NADH-quinone oxidoreductase subunit F